MSKVEIKVYKLAMSFQDTAPCFVTFCSSDQSLFLFKFQSFDYSSNVMTHNESFIEVPNFLYLSCVQPI